MTHLFPDFLSNSKEYNNCVEFWRTTVTEITSASIAGGWAEWLTTHFVSGDQILDGNPIYSCWCSKTKKAFKIIPNTPTHDALMISAWMDTFGSNHRKSPDYIEQLIIMCELSVESAELSKDLIRAWAGNLSLREMEHCIEKVISYSE